VDNDETQLTPKLYPPLRNVTDNIILAIGENILEYHVKLKASMKLKCNWASISKQVPLV
jgi:hypothetical protein